MYIRHYCHSLFNVNVLYLHMTAMIHKCSKELWSTSIPPVQSNQNLKAKIKDSVLLNLFKREHENESVTSFMTPRTDLSIF